MEREVPLRPVSPETGTPERLHARRVPCVMEHPLILASSSVSRKRILSRTGLEFATVTPDIDETPDPGESPGHLVERLARAKAEAVKEQFGHSLVIGSDQVGLIDGEILGKPRDHEDAVRQLTKCSGSELVLYAGVALLNTNSGFMQSDVDTFGVAYRVLSPEKIRKYLAAEKPYDSCGSLKVEGIGIALLERLTGSDPNTLMGFPLIKLLRLLEKEGVELV